MFQFGFGSRTCVGKHISLLEMRLLVPALYHNFELQLVKKDAELRYKCHWVSQRRLLWDRLLIGQHQFALPDSVEVLVRRRTFPTM